MTEQVRDGAERARKQASRRVARRMARQLADARAEAAWCRLQVVIWQSFSLQCIEAGMRAIERVERESMLITLAMPHYRWGVTND